MLLRGLTPGRIGGKLTFRFSRIHSSGKTARGASSRGIGPESFGGEGASLVALAVKDLIDAGVHFGHRASRWNPKMKPYIYGKRNMIHIIDLKETVRGLLRASKYFNRVASQNGLILFVGTKRQAAETIVEECTRCGDALRHRALAGRHADQLPDDPQPARTVGGTGIASSTASRR